MQFIQAEAASRLGLIQALARSMQRYRILSFDFDSRALFLDPIPDHWEDAVRDLHLATQAGILAELKKHYGELHFDAKLENFKALGPKPFSVVAFHNEFLSQARHAFVHGQYYPALTAVCALGERVLNHLVIGLRGHYKAHDLYKKVYRKDSFDHWPLAIDALSQWGILTPEAEAQFLELTERRNRAIHFNLETELNVKQLALEAIRNFEGIVNNQFSSFGNLPWLLPAPGECYIRKAWEQSPFVQMVYAPNGFRVGYKHVVTSVIPWQIEDPDDYPSDEISDEEFVQLRLAFQGAR
ncbi:hypothetical protein [Lysobacter terrae]